MGLNGIPWFNHQQIGISWDMTIIYNSSVMSINNRIIMETTEIWGYPSWSSQVACHVSLPRSQQPIAMLVESSNLLLHFFGD